MLGRRPDVASRLLDELAVALDVAVLQPFEHHAGVLQEHLAARVHRNAEPLVLDASQATADPENQPTAGEVVEHRDPLDKPCGVVPRQHDHAGTDLQVGASRDPPQELQGVGAHRVVGEVVLHRPDRVEAEVLGLLHHPHLLVPDLFVGECVLRVLEGD